MEAEAALEQAKENIAKLGAFHCDGDINAFGMRTVGTVHYDFELLKSAFGNPTTETAGRPGSPSAASHAPSEVEWRVMGVYDTQRMIVQVSWYRPRGCACQARSWRGTRALRGPHCR